MGLCVSMVLGPSLFFPDKGVEPYSVPRVAGPGGRHAPGPLCTSGFWLGLPMGED